MALQCLAFRRWRAAASVLIAGIAIGVTYFWRYQAPATDLWAVFKQPLVLLHYVVAYVGNPLGALGLKAATLAGAIALALLAWFMVLVRDFDQKDRPAIAFLLAVCALALGTALLTALGRLQLGLAYAVSSRYSALVEPMWAALLLMGLLWLNRQRGAGARRLAAARMVPFTAAGLLCVAVVFGQGYWKSAAAAYRERWETGATAAIARAPDRQALHSIGLEGEALDHWLRYIAEKRLSIFASEADWSLYRVVRGFWKQPIAAVMATHGKWCAGRLDPGTKVPGTQTWYRFAGYALDRESESVADGIVLADRDGSVIGIARPLAARPDLDGTLRLRSKGLKLHFVDYGEPSTGPVTAYALKLDRDTLCSIGEG